MVRYPFDVLRAVSLVEPLTMNVRLEIYNPFEASALRFTCLRPCYPPTASPSGQRLVKGHQRIEAWTEFSGKASGLT
jgi:hypothetical protein